MTQILLQAPQQGGTFQLIMLGGIILVFWFFMIRPQVKKQKDSKKFREGLAKGDKVVTIGGIHGKVVDMNDRTVLLQIDGAKIRVEKSALNPAGEASEEDIKTNS